MDRPLRIAIADDEPDIRRFYERSIRRQGHEVIASVGNGRELVEQCGASAPDLIVTDVLMPGMDGISATRQITGEHPVPVIVISSRDADDLDEFGSCGHVAAFLTKPVNLEQLIAAVSKVAESDGSTGSSRE